MDNLTIYILEEIQDKVARVLIDNNIDHTHPVYSVVMDRLYDTDTMRVEIENDLTDSNELGQQTDNDE